AELKLLAPKAEGQAGAMAMVAVAPASAVTPEAPSMVDGGLAHGTWLDVTARNGFAKSLAKAQKVTIAEARSIVGSGATLSSPSLLIKQDTSTGVKATLYALVWFVSGTSHSGLTYWPFTTVTFLFNGNFTRQVSVQSNALFSPPTGEFQVDGDSFAYWYVRIVDRQYMDDIYIHNLPTDDPDSLGQNCSAGRAFATAVSDGAIAFPEADDGGSGGIWNEINSAVDFAVSARVLNDVC
ncbi:MAG: hypothetical protein V4479_08015, partial [Actinomycetota bacterium]